MQAGINSCRFLPTKWKRLEARYWKLVPEGHRNIVFVGIRRKTLAVRVHKCDKCGIEIDRDIMSAIIIKFTALNGATAGSAVSNAFGDERLLSSMNQELSLHSI